MSDKARLKVVFCWHMHQPEYRNALTGRYLQPWTYLHAVKDYTDMAWHLESCPGARAVVNFVPIMLEEINDYSRQIRGFLEQGEPIRDPLLASLADFSIPLSDASRLELTQYCLRANEARMIKRFAGYSDLVQIVQSHRDRFQDLRYLSDQFFQDLLVWYHLAWLGESVRRNDIRARRLIEKSRYFNPDDRRQLLQLMSELIGELLQRYRRLAEQGRIELSMTPYAHPMMPLLIDFESAREALPDISLPDSTYPGGLERVRWHVENGLRVFNDVFGITPIGCWPSEGGVSNAILPVLAEHGFRWIASGQSVLRNSLASCKRSVDEGNWPYVAYRLHALPLYGFFRDDGLSDAIGFNYSDWHADDAVADLVNRLEHIANKLPHPKQHVVSIIMDGENAWEHYPENGYHFLSTLYRTLSSHPGIELTTYGDILKNPRLKADNLAKLCAGSWVYGTFSTWIGDPDKNRAWEILIQSKKAFDEVVAQRDFSDGDRAQLDRQLSVCEGSDWFWWFGDYNPAESIEDFSQLFRLHIKNLHKMLNRAPPKDLDASFGSGGVSEHGGVMRRGDG